MVVVLTEPGVGTALKILFSYEERSLHPKKNPNLFQKTEIVALLNTFGRLSESIATVERFRAMYLRRQHLEYRQSVRNKALRIVALTRDAVIRRSVAWADLLCERIPALKLYRQMLRKSFKFLIF